MADSNDDSRRSFPKTNDNQGTDNQKTDNQKSDNSTKTKPPEDVRRVIPQADTEQDTVGSNATQGTGDDTTTSTQDESYPGAYDSTTSAAEPKKKKEGGFLSKFQKKED